MTAHLKLVKNPHPSKKERLITSEIERRRHTLSYILEPYQMVLPEVMNMFPDTPPDAWIDIPPLAYTGHDRVVIFDENIRRCMKENAVENNPRKYEKITYVEILVHELSHIVCGNRTRRIMKKYKHNPLKTNPIMFGSHGALFRDTYTKLCHKYKIRYPDDRYFIDPE